MKHTLEVTGVNFDKNDFYYNFGNFQKSKEIIFYDLSERWLPKTERSSIFSILNNGLFYSFSHSTRLLAATTLRNVLGTKNLAEILSERESISHVMQSSLDDATDPWGVKVERVEMWVSKKNRRH